MRVDSPTRIQPPRHLEVLPAWPLAQRIARRRATAPLPSITALRTRGFLGDGRATRIAEWYTGRGCGGCTCRRARIRRAGR